MNVKASLSKGTVNISYNEDKVSLKDILRSLEDLGYGISSKSRTPWQKPFGFLILILGGYFIIKNTVGFNFIPEISDNMGYGLIFVVGLLTSIHCIAMCGGIALSQGLKYNNENQRYMSTLSYNIGRIISYTAIGGIVGGVGSILSPTGQFKGIVSLGAGIFMVIFGLKMLGILNFPSFLKFKIPFITTSHKERHKFLGSLYIGLLNGFMPCGPLQTMQLYALGTGSPVKGALSMFFFSLGTAPLMAGFGIVTSVIKGSLGKKMLKTSGVLVIFLGIIMMNRGLSLSGYSLDGIMNKSTVISSNVATIVDGKQIVNMTVGSNQYILDKEMVMAGIPVQLHLNRESITRCNNPLLIPKYNIEVNLLSDNNIIEFTPTETGPIRITCWMGMITTNLNTIGDTSSID